MAQLHTARLVLRPLDAGDVAVLVALWVDPAVTQFMGGPRDGPHVRQSFEDDLLAGFADPFHWWTVVEKASGRVVGMCGLHRKDVDGREEIELTYVFAADAWGRGYATEAASALRDDAFGRLGLSRLIALVHPENAASARVAEKLGMHLEREVLRPGGTLRRVYAMQAGGPP